MTTGRLLSPDEEREELRVSDCKDTKLKDRHFDESAGC